MCDHARIELRQRNTSERDHVPRATVEEACCERAQPTVRQPAAGAEPDEPCSSGPGCEFDAPGGITGAAR